MYRDSQEPSWQRENISNTKYTGDPLAVIYNEGQWRLSKVSPMYNLQYDAVKLKQYASKVRQAVVSSVPSNSSIKYTVQFEAQPMLKYSEDDADGLMITVSTVESTKSKVSFAAVLLSWGVSTSLSNGTHLPYLLERGEQRVGSAVKSTLQTIFDCNIKQYNFNQHQLLQFGFNFVESDTSKNTDPFSLIYTTPQVDHKDKLNLSFEVGDIHIIWNGIKDEVTKNSELVNLAYQVLQNQIFYMVMLDITVFDLCEIILPKAEVKRNGVVKMKSPEVVNCVFTVLNGITDLTFEREESENNSSLKRLQTML